MRASQNAQMQTRAGARAARARPALLLAHVLGVLEARVAPGVAPIVGTRARAALACVSVAVREGVVLLEAALRRSGLPLVDEDALLHALRQPACRPRPRAVVREWMAAVADSAAREASLQWLMERTTAREMVRAIDALLAPPQLLSMYSTVKNILNSPNLGGGGEEAWAIARCCAVRHGMLGSAFDDALAHAMVEWRSEAELVAAVTTGLVPWLQLQDNDTSRARAYMQRAGSDAAKRGTCARAITIMCVACPCHQTRDGMSDLFIELRHVLFTEASVSAPVVMDLLLSACGHHNQVLWQHLLRRCGAAARERGLQALHGWRATAEPAITFKQYLLDFAAAADTVAPAYSERHAKWNT